jgi:outer membrane protein assembly factor BamB
MSDYLWAGKLVRAVGRRVACVASLVAVLAVHAGSVGARDWNQFRGPDCSGVSTETNLPVKWSATEGIRWKAPLPGRGLSNPAIAAGRVFVTASSGYRESRLHLLCFDEKTGRKLWERQLASTGSTSCHPKTCMAAPCPVADGKNVYALFATADLAAFDRDGNLLWYRSLVGDFPNVSNQVGMAASPILYRDVLLVPMENPVESFLAGIDVKTGQNRWKVDRPRGLNWVSPTLLEVEGRTDAVFQSGAAAFGFDPETGRQRWTSPPGTAPATIPSPTPAGDGIVLIPGQQTVALKPGPAGQSATLLWKTSRITHGYCTPVAYKGRVYGATPTGVTCVDGKTGEPVWQQRVQGPFSASPVVGDGKLYLVNEQGTTTVLGLGDKAEVLATNALPGETFLATPAIANGALFLRTDQHMYCIGPR